VDCPVAVSAVAVFVDGRGVVAADTSFGFILVHGDSLSLSSGLVLEVVDDVVDAPFEAVSAVRRDVFRELVQGGVL